jgi:hypothetical protein
MPFGWGKFTEAPSHHYPASPPDRFILIVIHRDQVQLLTTYITGESQDAYNQVQSDDFNNQSSFGHEALAGAASFGAFKVFEDRQRADGTSSGELQVGIHF